MSLSTFLPQNLFILMYLSTWINSFLVWSILSYDILSLENFLTIVLVMMSCWCLLPGFGHKFCVLYMSKSGNLLKFVFLHKHPCTYDLLQICPPKNHYFADMPIKSSTFYMDAPPVRFLPDSLKKNNFCWVSFDYYHLLTLISLEKNSIQFILKRAILLHTCFRGINATG